jgi:photosystem II stability/assembly factor-like uncharacterized protein
MPALPLAGTFTPQPKATSTIETNTWTGIGPWVNISTIVIDPMTPAIIYAGTDGGVFKSMNGGESWSAINTGLTDYEVWDLVIDPITPRVVYAGTTGGVFKSMNGGENWSAVNTGLTDTDITGLAIDPATPATLYVVTRLGKLFKSINGGGKWSADNTGLTDNHIAIALAIDPVSPGTVYLGTYDAGVFKSTDGGRDWSTVNTGLGTTRDNPINGLVIDPVMPTTIYAVTRYNGIFKSTDGGRNWRAFYTHLDLPPASSHSFAIDPITPTTFYVGTYGGYLIKSTNGGENWGAFKIDLNNCPITALAIDPLTPTSLYAGTYGGGIFTNQINKTFAPVTMPSLTAIPYAYAEPPVTAIPAPTEDISPLPTLRPAEFPFRASGTLNYRKQIQLPENARIMVLWSVTAVDPDYGYVFGEGTMNFNNNSFNLVFDEPPPSEALNWVGSSALGVGIVIITADQTLKSGNKLPESFSTADILGAAGQYGIIYVNGSFEMLEKGGWFNEFNQGYSAGKGVDIPDTVFDGFEPIDPATIKIIIDDLENIEFVNWT